MVTIKRVWAEKQSVTLLRVVCVDEAETSGHIPETEDGVVVRKRNLNNNDGCDSFSWLITQIYLPYVLCDFYNVN